MVCSVIIPVRNREKYIEKSILSVLSQSVYDLEVIVVDDCSSDGTREIIREIMSRDCRVRLLECAENVGPAAARNIGVECAEGDLIAFLDSDDYWLPEKLEKELTIFNRSDVDMVCTSAITINENNLVLSKQFIAPETFTYKKMLKGNDVVMSSLIVKKEVLIKYPFVSGSLHEDYVFLLSALKENRICVGLHDLLTAYRIHTDSQTGNKLHSMCLTRNSYKYIGIKFPTRMYYLLCNAFHGIKKHYLSGTKIKVQS